MATIHRSADGKELFFVKGASEVILDTAIDSRLVGGQPAPLNRAHFTQTSDMLASFRAAAEATPYDCLNPCSQRLA